jgi:hypothetical protein
MRLTLRTLLAYMDEILEPADQEELAKKIESSEFANDLILRTKDTMRRLRLSAPQLVGTGMGLDPNTVAEYLDNVLPPDSVADLERICLESDVHLAEVASCHHVLTMVLGEPAEVDPAARERMYAISSEIQNRKQIRVEPAHAAVETERPSSVTTPVPPAFAAAMTLPPLRTKSRDIPDYLRASAWNRYRVLLMALAAVLVFAVTMLLVSGLKGWRSGTSQSAADSANVALRQQQSAPPDANMQEPVPPLSNDRSTNGASPNVNETQVNGASADSPYTVPGKAAAPTSGPPPLLTPAFAGPQTASSTTTPTNSSEATPALPSDVAPVASNATAGTNPTDRYASAPPVDTTPTTLTPPASPIPAVPAGGETAVASNTPLMTSEHPGVALTKGSGPAAPAATTKDTAGEAVAELGTYLDGKEILLRNDPQSGAWFRLVPRSAVHAKDRLLALPAFHPRITLSSGVQLKLAGGTEVSLGSAGNATKEDIASHRAVPELEVVFGRVVIVNTANAENMVQLKIGATSAQVRLVQNATLAIEILRSFVPGRDPRQFTAPVVAHLYAPDGNIVWTDAGGEQTIHAPQQWDIADGVVSPVVAATSFPDWIDHEPAEQRSEQLYGAPVVEQSLDAKSPIGDQLLELFQTSKKREVKSLVARSSVYVGLFVPFVDALRDSDQRAIWPMHIETLRKAMSLGPDSANKIWDTLKEQRGEPAAHDLYEMLCGYSLEQVGRTQDKIEAGPIPRLIDWLENESLDYRVLAVQDLGEITGKHLMPHPEASPTERAKGVRIWRERLKSGEVTAIGNQ